MSSFVRLKYWPNLSHRTTALKVKILFKRYVFGYSQAYQTLIDKMRRKNEHAVSGRKIQT
jgi:hypothetical protein